jgi:hypothetical protein
MHREQLRQQARVLADSGLGPTAIARRLGLPGTTVWNWLNRTTHTPPQPCPRCDPDRGPDLGASYCYLLGQYLGDGHLVTRAKVPVLRIYATEVYPRIVDEIDGAIAAVRGIQPGHVTGKPGVTGVQSYWNHWPCLFPQHGPGLKHRRSIVLAGWQDEIVRKHPRELIRGLIHSDGCRVMNNVTVRGTRYSYPRYFFSNESGDIRGIFTAALDRLGIPWRANRVNSISVARRTAVAALDEFVGPKH